MSIVLEVLLELTTIEGGWNALFLELTTIEGGWNALFMEKKDETINTSVCRCLV